MDQRHLIGAVAAAIVSLSTAAGAQVTATEGSLGSGDMVSDFQLSEDTKSFLDAARAAYAPYEVGDALTAAEDFVEFSIIGEDDRRAVLSTTGFPARAIVQIMFLDHEGKEALCSGAMISKDTVLTAGHCVHSGTRLGQPFTGHRVIPGRNRGVGPFGECGVRKQYALTGWTRSPDQERARDYDLGALKLDCEVGRATGWMAMRLLDDTELDLATTVHGYASDSAPPGRQWFSEDKLRVLQDLKGFYQNDTVGGTSGSPVYTAGDTSIMFGVHTNGVHGKDEPWASNNAFTRFTEERLTRIMEWINDS